MITDRIGLHSVLLPLLIILWNSVMQGTANENAGGIRKIWKRSDQLKIETKE